MNSQLYGYHVKTGSSHFKHLNILINMVQSHYLEWDLNNIKFIKMFNDAYFDYDGEHNESDVYGIIIDQLCSAVDCGGAGQNVNLMKLLIEKTNNTANPMNSSIKNVTDILSPNDEIHKLVKELNINSVGRLVQLQHDDIKKAKYGGSEVLLRLINTVSDWISYVAPYECNNYGTNCNVDRIINWINDDYIYFD